MTKTFEELLFDADVCSFEEEIQRDVIKISEDVFCDEVLCRPLRIKFGSADPIGQEHKPALVEKIFSRGDYEELMSLDKHEREIAFTEKEQEEGIWVTISGNYKLEEVALEQSVKLPLL